MNPKAAAIYARISEDRDGDLLGVTRQLKDCRAYAELKGWIIADEYVDDDVSAYHGKPRPEYRRMLADIREGRLDGVVVWHLDRLHRHPKELEEFFDVCDAAKLIHLATVSGDVDLASHDRRFNARIQGAVARKESDDKSRRAIRKALELAEAGRPNGGRRPYAYTVERQVVPEEAEVVREAARRLLAGETLRTVAADFNSRGVPTVHGGEWRGHVLKQIVTSSRNAGHRTLHGRVVAAAAWEAILPDADVKRLQDLLRDPARRLNRAPRRHLLVTLLYCSLCGAKLVSRPSRGKATYVCANDPGRPGCGKISILAEPVESFIRDAVLYRLDSPDLDRAVRQLPDGDQLAGELEVAIAEDQAQLEQLAGMWGAKRIEMAEYLAAREPISIRLDASKARLGRLDRRHSVRRLAGQGGELSRQWPTLNLDQRRAIIKAMLDRVTVQPAHGPRRFDPSRLEPVWRV